MIIVQDYGGARFWLARPTFAELEAADAENEDVAEEEFVGARIVAQRGDIAKEDEEDALWVLLAALLTGPLKCGR